MKTLSIDLGKSWGWAYKDGQDEEYGEGKYIELTDWGDQVKKLINKWKPDIVVASQTNSFGHFNAVRAMLKQAGVLFYICGKKNIPGIELNDSQSRKIVLGKGMKKVEAQAMFPDLRSNELDALIIARAANILFNENK